METAFADTVYWQALLDVKDSLYGAARILANQLRADRVRIITSEMVLTEVLNALGKSETGRRSAINFIQSLRDNPNVEIAQNAECPFDTAFDFYKKRPDKQWGHTDCSSFIIMQNRGIYYALTHDHHFTQAGFAVLL